MSKASENKLRVLPPVNDLLEHPNVLALIAEQGRNVVMGWIHDALAYERSELLSAGNNGAIEADRDSIIEAVVDRVTGSARMT